MIIFLLMILLNPGSLGKDRQESRQTADEALQNANNCPLCSSQLKKGERVFSVVYPGENDRLMEISGCPRCRPPELKQSSPKHSNTGQDSRGHDRPAEARICPVCKKQLQDSELVYARLFLLRGKKPHVHVNGCSSCLKGRRPAS